MGAASDTSERTDWLQNTARRHPRDRFTLLLSIASATLAILALWLVVSGWLQAGVPLAQPPEIVSFVTALALLVAGLVVLRLCPGLTSTAQVVAMLCFTHAAYGAALLASFATEQALLTYGVLALVAAGYGWLALNFPAPRWTATPARSALPVALGVVVVLVLMVTRVSALSPALTALLSLLLVPGLLSSRRYALQAEQRAASETVLSGILLALAPLALIWLLTQMTAPASVGDTLYLLAPLLALPVLSLVVAVLRPQRADGRLLSQSVMATLLLLAVIAGYFLLVLGVSALVGQWVGANHVGVMALVLCLIAVALWLVGDRLRARADAVFTRARRTRVAQAETFAQELATLTSADAILTAFRARLTATLSPKHVFIFLPDAATGEYRSADTDLRFAADSPLVRLLSDENLLTLDSTTAWPPDAVTERGRLRALGAAVLAGLEGRNGLYGFIVVGPPVAGGRYDHEALDFIRSVTRQISVAVERAQSVDLLEQRVRELGVLSQVSQAVNFTLNFDDLLELIATQTERLVDASHLYIVLSDETGGELYFAFFLEHDERYSARENQRWPLGRDLFSDVIRSGQPLRLVDYSRAIADRGLQPGLEDGQVKAWMAVPLVAGPRPFGVLAVATSEPGRPYSDAQFNSLVEIASLAATSIDKARLFEETNARARQLAALNDVSRQLVAVESDLDTLLTRVTETAVGILGADSGALLLADDDGALRYDVVRGMGRESLVGQLLAEGQDVAVHMARQGEAVRLADVEIEDARVHALAVPLGAQDSVIGVLEVLNTASRRPFSQADVNLLLTFAGQATVAIENARLFQLTDFQLSQRVAELESMERIDVELNRSLELSRVAEITLQTAVDYSGATAGLLGLLVPEQAMMRVVASHGYLTDIAQSSEEPGQLPIDHGLVERVIRTRRADLVLDPSQAPDSAAAAHVALGQLAVPMLSGGAVSAVLLLETDREPRFNLAHLAYIQRLAEHASVAIANAQLYRELERANQSKSEFVSFVAHELKNPLTSIKGYSDILAKGAVGPLSDQQKMFVGTIRANADRMNTLVSDLNDVTKLQTNNMRIDLADIGFGDVVTETLRPLQPLIDGKGQTLHVAVPPELPPVRGDKTRLIQVLTNLVSNAHKYTPEDGDIRLEAGIDLNRRDGKGRPLGPMLHVQVRDTGIGMSEADLSKLFTAYFRSDNPQAREQPGTGLGLTITQGLVVRHGGEIWAESAIGEGTTFHFTVPLAGTGD